MKGLLDTIQANWTTYAEDAVVIMVIWVVATILMRSAAKIITASHRKQVLKLTPERQRRAETAATITKSLSRYIIVFLAIAATVGQLGLTPVMNSLLAAAGVGGIALGIGAQSFIKDVVAGLFLIFEDQMAVGDYITAADVTGTVEEITLRSTVVRGFRGEINVIPNGSIGVLVNFSRADYLAMVDVEIDREADIARAERCMREEAEAYAKESDTAVDSPEVLGVTAVGGEGVTMRMVLRVKPMTQWAAERALNRRIKERFEKEDIPLAFRRLIVKSDAGAQSAADINGGSHDRTV
ncbi:MAG TPA: mechanosensitive ion channel family protein [Feifaniaceae bacterium]|nr:mechanosensitive ion channel family protein [Feifaniaceae bacterium]